MLEEPTLEEIQRIANHLNNMEQRMHNLEELLDILVSQLKAKNTSQEAIVINTVTTNIGGTK